MAQQDCSDGRFVFKHLQEQGASSLSASSVPHCRHSPASALWLPRASRHQCAAAGSASPQMSCGPLLLPRLFNVSLSKASGVPLGSKIWNQLTQLSSPRHLIWFKMMQQHSGFRLPPGSSKPQESPHHHRAMAAPLHSREICICRATGNS